jgi:hypothetical protein
MRAPPAAARARTPPSARSPRTRSAPPRWALPAQQPMPFATRTLCVTAFALAASPVGAVITRVRPRVTVCWPLRRGGCLRKLVQSIQHTEHQHGPTPVEHGRSGDRRHRRIAIHEQQEGAPGDGKHPRRTGQTPPRARRAPAGCPRRRRALPRPRRPRRRRRGALRRRGPDLRWQGLRQPRSHSAACGRRHGGVRARAGRPPAGSEAHGRSTVSWKKAGQTSAWRCRRRSEGGTGTSDALMPDLCRADTFEKQLALC